MKASARIEKTDGGAILMVVQRTGKRTAAVMTRSSMTGCDVVVSALGRGRPIAFLDVRQAAVTTLALLELEERFEQLPATEVGP